MEHDEKEIAYKLAEVWDLFVELPVEHPCDRDEFCKGVHFLQNMILARAGRRELNK